jgi:outer membrane lipoprotein-sorting protein
MRTLLFLLALLTLLPLCALAAQPDEDIRAAQAWLQDLKTLKARFIQTSNDGRQLSGDFLLWRPGRMRFQYDAPITDFIVAYGRKKYYYDGEMKEQSNTLIGNSLADFFLREDISFTGDLTVSGTSRDGGLLQVTLVETREPEIGSLTLGFAENPLQLKKWRIVDAQGAITEVELFDVKTGLKLDDDLFHYYDPEHKKLKYN